MQAMGPILFPVDFSPRCRAVVPLVKATAVKLGAKVTLFYAIQIPDSLFTTERPHSIMIDTEATLSDAREELLRFYAAPAESVDATAEIGDPALKIVEYAGNHGIGLIMIPTHGYGTFRSLLQKSSTTPPVPCGPPPILKARNCPPKPVTRAFYVPSIYKTAAPA